MSIAAWERGAEPSHRSSESTDRRSASTAESSVKGITSSTCAIPTRHALDGDQIELFEGFNLFRLPGHTLALPGLRLDLANAGTFILTSDQFHLRDNYEGPQPLGRLLRDHAAWWRSYRVVKSMADRTDARLVFGHDADVLTELKQEPFYD